MTTPKVAVIGAGALGLMALKNFQEDGFDVTGFESRPYVGGLWKDSDDSALSVHPTTSFNSSKYRSAISDFPFSEDTDDFPTAPQMHKYLTSYSDHFGLTSRICFNTKVIGLDRVGDKWALAVQPHDGPIRTEHFDKVAVSTGSYSQPKRLNLKGIEHFAGSNIHAIDYHNAEKYRNQNVLIIGMHASAQDVAASLQDSAKKVYMSHRNGIVLIPKYTPDGAVFDSQGSLHFMLIQAFMATWFPRLWTWILDNLILSVSRQAFTPRPEWRLLPAPSMGVAVPLIGDKIFALLNSEFATPVAEIEVITGPKTIALVDGTTLTDIDAIIQCTGYDFATPFIPSSSPYQPYLHPNSPPHLYRNIFPLSPDLKIRTSLAFLGQVQIFFPGFIQSELTIQSISQVWRGRAHLPPLPTMQKWHTDNLAWRAQMTRIYGHSSTFYAALVPFGEHMQWIDETSGAGVFKHFDWAWLNWRSWSLWWRDRDLYRVCMGGLFTPAIWRLFDCGGRKAWRGAREQIFKDNEALERQKANRMIESKMLR